MRPLEGLLRYSRAVRESCWLLSELCEPAEEDPPRFDSALLLSRAARCLWRSDRYSWAFAVVSDQMFEWQDRYLLSAHELVRTITAEVAETLRSGGLAAARPTSLRRVGEALARRAGSDRASHDGEIILSFPTRTIPSADGSSVEPAALLSRHGYRDWWQAPCAAFSRATLGANRWRAVAVRDSREAWEPTIVSAGGPCPTEAAAFVAVKLDEEVASGRCRELLGCFHPRKLSALVEREQFKALDHFSSKGDEALKRLVFSFPRVTVPSEERRGVAGYGDGPVPPDRFRWRDIEVSGITTKPFRLLTLLWEQRPQGATLDQVCRAVWLDENVDADWNLVRNHRKPIDGLFKRHGIPWRTKPVNDRLLLEPARDEERP